jgi:hypothetical protein
MRESLLLIQSTWDKNTWYNEPRRMGKNEKYEY